MLHTVWVFNFSPTLIMCCCFLFVRTYDILYIIWYILASTATLLCLTITLLIMNSVVQGIYISSLFFSLFHVIMNAHLWCCQYWWCSTILSIIRDYMQYCHRYWQCFTNSVDGLLVSTHHIVAFCPFLTHVFMNMNTTNTYMTNLYQSVSGGCLHPARLMNGSWIHTVIIVTIRQAY